ncbi:EcsC family protein [Methylocystis parvus]|uniref:EcsC family protein n=1 Tax=Methylocystis parvus TaxID=134 RepID=A0A6B8M910_9HYPH|nr:EcsC family protein [Methylocystis parvus]QGM99106.1 EcsC family protein [Methylocystis parvus]WBK00524.1 EcsC family protein [Methylocystis parvus OBBP]
MSLIDPRSTPLTAEHRKMLARAVAMLERESLAQQLSDYASQPITQALQKMPKPFSASVNRAAQKAVLRCLTIALNSLEPKAIGPPRARSAVMLAAASGGVGGLFGAASLAIELPVTTILMLRSIAEIARHSGEDLTTLEARLACVEVFALSAQPGKNRTDLSYYASRAVLNRLSRDMAGFVVESGVAGAATSAGGRFVTEIAARLGVAISERAAASAVPILGALGGATVNVIFMNHYQKIARSHFLVRRLERLYGADVVRREYMILSKALEASRTAEQGARIRPSRAEN